MNDQNLNDNVNDKKPIKVIEADESIHNGLTVCGNLLVFGNINGDVDCSGDIKMFGKIKGNIHCNNLFIEANGIDGDIDSKSLVQISNGTVVRGNINAWTIYADGNISGNVDAVSLLHLGSECILNGNISADEIEIKRGAQIDGKVSVETT